MEQRIEYIVKGQPTTIKKVSAAIIGIAGLVIVVLDFIYMPLRALPLELQVFAMGEVIPRLFFEFNLVAFLLILAGFGLYYFRWRKGTIELTDRQIIINGLIGVSVLIEKVEEIAFLHSKYIGNRRLIQIVSCNNVFKVKFENEDSFTDFAQKLVIAAAQFEGIKIDTSFVH